MLEKIEKTIKNGQSRDTATQHTGRRQQQNPTTPKTKKMSNTDPTK